MSRLIVKNLPKSVTTEKLQGTFGEKGAVTDVQLKYTKDGKFRHFGFVGFKTEAAAQQALEYFNNTCINGSKIVVELCSSLGDPNKPKAWSKYSTDSSAFKKLQKKSAKAEPPNQDEHKSKSSKPSKVSKVQEILDKHKDDPLFTEYMEAHEKGNKTMWGNDSITRDEVLKVTEEEHEEDAIEEESGHDSHNNASSSEDEEEQDRAATKKISDLEYLKIKTVKGEGSMTEELNEGVSNEKGHKKQIKKPKEPKSPVKLFTVKVRGLAYKAKKKDVKQFFHPLKPRSIRVPVKIKGIAYVGFKTEKEMKQALTKHKGFLAGKRIWVIRYSGQDEETEEGLPRQNNKWKDQEEDLKNEETIAESGRLFVRNLSYMVTEDDIDKLFNKYGALTEVAMPVDRLTRKAKGFAVVTFLFPEHAVKAYTDLDGSVFHGRMLHLLPGKAKKSLEELLEMEGLTHKQKKLLKMKSQAASSHNWNSLFLGQNAVADIIADAYNTTKDKVLDTRGSESLAVRLALGETQIVSQTREFLVESGVHLDAFNQNTTPRSKTVILAKNLPAKTTLGEIREVFGKHGEMGRVVLPPSGITAIVEFLEPSEARNAFKKLAYSKFKHLPLYLEWAPTDAFTAELPKVKSTKKDKPDNAKGGTDESITAESTLVQSANEGKESSEDEDEAPEPDTTLFIKNLNFNTEEEAVKEHFKKCGPVHYVTVAKKKDPKNPGQLLSMGYGFIQFKRKECVEKALKTLQQSLLEGHSVELKRSNRTLQSDVVTTRKKTKIGKQTGSKILVRNIPFQATLQEVKELFKTFGELKALRLPKKMVGTGSHRGFAFVDYYTKHDAKRAFKALCQSTHLYGRRLVLEWATTEENVDDLRKRTAEHFHKNTSNHNLKKSTVELDIEETFT